jgi:ketosteroid isomerase-like protein
MTAFQNRRSAGPRVALTCALTCLLALAAPLAHSEPSAFDSLVEAERSFARHSVTHGMRPAFLEYLAPNAVLFRAGPVNGVRLWQARQPSPIVLDWTPSFAEISGSGDFGFTTGPWTIAASKDTAASGFGHFVSVWRRDALTGWRVVADIGISHPDPGTPLRQVKVVAGPVHAPPESLRVRGWDAGAGVRRGNTSVGIGTGGIGIGVGSGGLGIGLGTGGTISRGDALWRRMRNEVNRLLSAERTLAFTARNKGWERGYRSVAAGDMRVYREGHAPSIGAEAAIEWNAKVPTSREWQVRDQAVSPSWDLGYSYGIAIARAKGARPDTASYVHLWRKDDTGEWRLMLDIENPFPKR